MMRSLLQFALGAVLACAATLAQAQNINGAGTYGTQSLVAGAFPNDPVEVSVVAGGGVDAAQSIGGLCKGMIAENPDLTVDYSMGNGELYFSVDAGGADTTLVVYAPDGFYYCSDDDAGDRDPGVYLPKPAAGRYQVWVGVYTADVGYPSATVYISERNYFLATPIQPENLAQPGATPNAGAAALQSGFEPDPYTVAVRAGGGTAVSEGLAQCNGYVSVNPDFHLDWTAGAGSLPLILSVSSEADTTLLVRRPDGRFICDDDGGEQGSNPALRINAPPSGPYEIWVGTFAGNGGAPPAVLNISELTSH